MAAINAADRPVHPADPRITGCHHVFLHAPGRDGADSRTRWRSTPAGSTARRAAPGRAPGWPSCTPAASCALGEPFVNESFIGTRFTGPAGRGDQVGGLPAVVPEITGRAWVTGTAQYLLDPDDPFPAGFSL